MRLLERADVSLIDQSIGSGYEDVPFFTCCLIVMTQVAYAQRQASIPLYQQVVESLSHGDAVIPIVPDVHPLKTVCNREAIIPPQCYTDTEGIYNPCYVCHQNTIKGRENIMNDGGLQIAYRFSDLGMTNHWKICLKIERIVSQT